MNCRHRKFWSPVVAATHMLTLCFPFLCCCFNVNESSSLTLGLSRTVVRFQVLRDFPISALISSLTVLIGEHIQNGLVFFVLLLLLFLKWLEVGSVLIIFL